jgi:hypothetical protein
MPRQPVREDLLMRDHRRHGPGARRHGPDCEMPSWTGEDLRTAVDRTVRKSA